MTILAQRIDEIVKDLAAYVGESHLTQIESAIYAGIEAALKMEPSANARRAGWEAMERDKGGEVKEKRKKSPFCTWTEDDEGGPWSTTCGNCFSFTDDGPAENGAKYCLYCSKPLLSVACAGEWHKP